MKTLNEIRPVKKEAEVNLIKRLGVTGVDIGNKYVGGKKTDELSIRVYVEKKKGVSAKEMIPKAIKGIKTDVIERIFVLHTLRMKAEELEVKVDSGQYDPLVGGISIGPCRTINGYIYGGTLGTIVKDRDSNDIMLLSNFHVMCVDNSWSPGDEMCQPARIDGGNCPIDVVGTLQRAFLGGQLDCAVALQTARSHSCEIVDIGDVKGTATASVNLPVRKRGRTTSLTYGIVDTVDLTVNIDYGGGIGVVTLTDQIGIDVDSSKCSKFGISGDSGSVVVNDKHRVVGLYFAGNPVGTYGVANPIQAVLDKLNIKMCIPVIKKIEKLEKLEKIEKPEKLEKPEKFEKPERPEKFEKLEKLEKSEHKELTKEIKDKDKEWEGFPPRPPHPFQAGRPDGSLEERITNLEMTVNQLTHFIKPELRPNLSLGALKREPDVSSADIASTSKKLQKEAADAKQAKDNKDMEKLNES